MMMAASQEPRALLGSLLSGPRRLAASQGPRRLAASQGPRRLAAFSQGPRRLAAFSQGPRLESFPCARTGGQVREHHLDEDEQLHLAAGLRAVRLVREVEEGGEGGDEGAKPDLQVAAGGDEEDD